MLIKAGLVLIIKTVILKYYKLTHDPSEIIICWFAAQETFIFLKVNI